MTDAIYVDDWLFRFYLASAPSRGLVLALHGWTGNETSMDVFIRNLPQDLDVISPRAPYRLDSGGYSWIDTQIARKAPLSEYALSANNMLNSLPRWLEELNLSPQPVHLIGFSQGAAVAYTVLLTRPQSVGVTAALAGFLPTEHEAFLGNLLLQGKPVFISHGTKDEIVPVHMAHSAAAALEKSGAQVTYCEDAVGHKLGASCFRRLAQFFAELPSLGE